MKKLLVIITISASLVFGAYEIEEAPSIIEVTQKIKTKEQLEATVINLAGKQRMLTQKMVKEALFVLKGIKGKECRANLLLSIEQFDKTLKGLLNGDEQLGLQKTKDEKIFKQLMKVSNLWVSFKDSLKKGDIDVINNQNIPLLENMDKVVQMYQDNVDSSLDPSIAKTIDTAGKQRMLTQKMTKELLLAANGVEVNNNIENAKNTFYLFKRTLSQLKSSTKDDAVKKQLNLIDTIMHEYETIIVNKDISDKMLREVQSLNMRLLKESNNAVKIYEATIK